MSPFLALIFDSLNVTIRLFTMPIKNSHHEFMLGKIQDTFFVGLNPFKIMTEVANYTNASKRHSF